MRKNEHTHIFPNLNSVMDFIEKHQDIATVLHKQAWGSGKYKTNFPEAEVVMRYPTSNHDKVKGIIAGYFKQ